MFSFFKKAPEIVKSVSFVEKLLFSANSLQDVNVRLTALTTIKLTLEELEYVYSVECAELGSFDDSLYEAFDSATSSEVMFECAIDLRFRDLDGSLLEKDIRFEKIEEHLKIRLIRIWAEFNFYGIKFHESEYKIENQVAFYELEQLDISDSQKSIVLCERYLICDWKPMRYP